MEKNAQSPEAKAKYSNLFRRMMTERSIRSARRAIKPVVPRVLLRGINLSGFLFRQRFLGFPVDDAPAFDQRATALFTEMLRHCRFYLEYGSGGSTVMAARLGKPFISIDTDGYFLNSVRKKIGTLLPTQQLLHADIGLNQKWGVPLFKTPKSGRLKKWKIYPSLPWTFINPAFMPDLILIDGRFRVASALTCFAHLSATPEAKVLVDDYVDRPYYHIIEKFGKLVGLYGRMAMFQPPQQLDRNMAEMIDYYSSDWR